MEAIQETMSHSDRIIFARDGKAKTVNPTDVGRHVSCGCLQSMPDSEGV
jgi:hypothetical protein